jgi:hypothetical protein
MHLHQIEYEGNDQLYAILKNLTISLMDIKNIIEKSFIKNQGTICKINRTINEHHYELNILKLPLSRNFFQEHMTQIDKNMAKLLKELIFEFPTKRNEALKISLDIARNTWRTVDDVRIKLEGKTYFLGKRRSTEDD